MSDRTPYIGFSNDALDRLPTIKEGDFINCPHCNNQHIVLCGTTKGQKTDLLMYYKCGDDAYACGVTGKNIMNQKSDLSGNL